MISFIINLYLVLGLMVQEYEFAKLRQDHYRDVSKLGFLVSSTFSVILLTKVILETCAFYFVSPHKHENISKMF